jgi:hypothetical protein
MRTEQRWDRVDVLRVHGRCLERVDRAQARARYEDARELARQFDSRLLLRAVEDDLRRLEGRE